MVRSDGRTTKHYKEREQLMKAWKMKKEMWTTGFRYGGGTQN